MIIAHWAPWFRRLYGDTLPVNYLGFDVETSGWDRERDVILEWGSCVVRDRVCVNRCGILVNWYASDVIPAAYLDERIARVRRQMSLNGRHWHITPELLQEKGVEPRKALQFVYDLISECRAQGDLLVSQNGWNFDYPMLVNSFAQDLLLEFSLGDNEMLDTGAIEKATQLYAAGHAGALPRPGETMKAYFRRVQFWRAKGVYWNLEHCVRKYGLDTRHALDLSGLHAAEMDAYMLHLLVEEFRGMAENVSLATTTTTAAAAAATKLTTPATTSTAALTATPTLLTATTTAMTSALTAASAKLPAAATAAATTATTTRAPLRATTPTSVRAATTTPASTTLLPTTPTSARASTTTPASTPLSSTTTATVTITTPTTLPLRTTRVPVTTRPPVPSGPVVRYRRQRSR